MLRRSGLLARKEGMTQLAAADGEVHAVTVLRLDSTRVVGLRSQERDGYAAVCVGAGRVKDSKVARPQRIAARKMGVEPSRRVVEFRVDGDALLSLGDELLASHFVPGQRVDVASVSKGKGFAGAMKRHNFGGLGASHGVSVSHRSHGSVGGCQDPGRVWKGKKMAGHMGDVRVTTQNLRVVEVDVDRGLVIVAGSVPGARGGWVEIRDAVKSSLPEGVPFPASVRPAGDGDASSGSSAVGEDKEGSGDGDEG